MTTYKLYWIPRTLAIIFILFLFLMAIDTFSGEASIFEKIGGFIMHSLSNITLIVALIVAWKRPVIGGLLFICLGGIFTVYYRNYNNFANFLLISFPVILTGVLFIVVKVLERKESQANKAQ